MRQSGIDLSSECSETERACIAEAIKRLSAGGNFLEVGTAAGGTLKEIIQTDTVKTRCNVATKKLIPNVDSNRHTTIEDQTPQRKNTRKTRRMTPTRVTWTENQIYEYIPEDQEDTSNTIHLSLIHI